MKYVITFQDCFSFAVVKKEADITPKQADIIRLAILDSRIVKQYVENGINYNWIPKKILPTKLQENKKIRSSYYAYFNLSVNQRINLRQYRNALNINWLFSTCINGFSREDKGPEFPVNNQVKLYHVCGKQHSQYPKN